MKFLDLYLYANIYILFFWVFYKIFINRTKLFHGNRVFLLSAFPLSLLLPILQNNLSTYLESNETLSSALSPISFIYSTGRIANVHSVNGSLSAGIGINHLIFIILITGFLTTLGYFLLKHIRRKGFSNNLLLILKSSL